MKHIEDREQVNLFNWSKLKAIKVHGVRGFLFDFLYAIPNGGKRRKAEAGRLKKQGVKAGVSDVHLPIAMGGYIGLWIELKRPIVIGTTKPVASPAQKEWLERMREAGHRAELAFGFEQAKEIIESYLSGDDTLPGAES